MKTLLAPSQESLSGMIERVTFHHEDNGFCVLRVKVKGHRDLVTLIGNCASVTAGEWIHAQGLWVQDRQHGQQFKAHKLTLTAPTTLAGLERYLGSGLIKGIGPVYAGKLVAAFKEAVFDVIEKDPQKLLTIPGIGPLRAQKIAAGWSAQKSIRDIMLFLHSHGVSTTKAVRIYKKYGHNAIPLIQENPYKLAQDIHGLGFLSADKIANSLGISKTSMIRARAGIAYVLLKALEEGHCGLPLDSLLTQGQELLSLEPSFLEEALALEIADHAVISATTRNTPCFFLSGLHKAESGIAKRLQDLLHGPLPWSQAFLEEILKDPSYAPTLSLSEGQKKALTQALTSKVTMITGGPGVGKTTLLKSILHILKASELSIALAAPTGRAAKRMSEATGMEAKTLHRLLEVDPVGGGFKKNENCPPVLPAPCG